MYVMLYYETEILDLLSHSIELKLPTFLIDTVK